jgi:hypothetical protein
MLIQLAELTSALEKEADEGVIGQESVALPNSTTVNDVSNLIKKAAPEKRKDDNEPEQDAKKAKLEDDPENVTEKAEIQKL